MLPRWLDKAWSTCAELAGITHHFTPHGLRYTFTDLVRLAKVDAVVRRALTGHVTEEMQRKYSTVGLDEKRSAIAGALAVVRSHQVAVPEGVHTGEGVNAGVNAGRNEDRPVERLAPTSRDRSRLFERDKGFEPSTFSLGS